MLILAEKNIPYGVFCYTVLAFTLFKVVLPSFAPNLNINVFKCHIFSWDEETFSQNFSLKTKVL